MTTQLNTPSKDHALITAAKRRLRWKAAFALPLIFACSALTGCLDYVDHTSERATKDEEFYNEHDEWFERVIAEPALEEG